MSERSVSAVVRICKLLLLMQEGAPQTIKQLHTDLTEVHGIKVVPSSVWRDLLTLEQHGIVERIKPTGHRGWLFRLKGISRWQTQ